MSLVVQVFSVDNLRNHNWYKYPLCTGSVLYIKYSFDWWKEARNKKIWIQIEKLINNLACNMFTSGTFKPMTLRIKLEILKNNERKTLV